MRKTVSNAKHPVAAFFHLLFKVTAVIIPFIICTPLHDITIDWRAEMWLLKTSVQGMALFTYLFGGVIFSSYVFIFVICILLLAFDFWTVKVLDKSNYGT